MKVVITSDTHLGYTSLESLAKMLKNIKNENPDVLLHCGDVSIVNYLEQKEFWELVREILPNCKIITVMGNHDWWDSGRASKFNSCEELFSKVKEIYAVNKIHHASENIVIDNVAFSGWDGWYSDPRTIRVTNDKSRIPNFFVERSYLEKRNIDGFNNCINFLSSQTDKIKIAITHFGITPECLEDWKSFGGSNEYFGNDQRMFDRINFVDYLFYGHSHLQVFEKYGKTTVMNCGSDYKKPKFLVVNI